MLSHVRAFALAVSSSQDAIFPDLPMAGPQMALPRRGLPSIEIGPPAQLHRPTHNLVICFVFLMAFTLHETILPGFPSRV